MQIRILTLSWEYPPYKIGGIAEHAYEPDFIARMNEEMEKIGATIIESHDASIDIIDAPKRSFIKLG